MSILLTPAGWFHVPRVGVGPEVVAFWVSIKVEPYPITLDLKGKGTAHTCELLIMYREKGIGTWSFAEQKPQTTISTHTSATVSTQNRDG